MVVILLTATAVVAQAATHTVEPTLELVTHMVEPTLELVTHMVQVTLTPEHQSPSSLHLFHRSVLVFPSANKLSPSYTAERRRIFITSVSSSRFFQNISESSSTSFSFWFFCNTLLRISQVMLI